MKLLEIKSSADTISLRYECLGRVFKTRDIERMSVNGNVLILHMHKPLADFCEIIDGVPRDQVSSLFQALTTRSESRLTPARDWRRQFSDWGICHVAE
jgi:hypothetical protein